MKGIGPQVSIFSDNLDIVEYNYAAIPAIMR